MERRCEVSAEMIVSWLALFVSFLVLVIQVCTFLVNRKKSKNDFQAKQSEAMTKITEAHRTLFFEILKDDKLTILSSQNKDSDKFREEMLGTLLVNHSNLLYTYAKKGLIEDDDWDGIQNDIADFYSWEIVKKRWQEIKRFYSTDFIDFINNLVERGRKTEISK